MTDKNSNTIELFKTLHEKELSCGNENEHVFRHCVDENQHYHNVNTVDKVDIGSHNLLKNWLVILQKTTKTKTNESRQVFDSRYAVYRGSEFLVKKIINIDNPKLTTKKIINTTDGEELEYIVGKLVKIDDYDGNLEKIFSNGIHYFKSLEPAYFFNGVPKNFTGTYISWHDNGHKKEECNYINGSHNGKYYEWHYNGKKAKECEFVDDYYNGNCIAWYDNGQKTMECEYIDDELDGKYNLWYKNGQKHIKCKYVNGELTGKYYSWYKNGQKHEESEYKKNSLNGKYILWNNEGKKLMECTYLNGKKC